MSNSNGYSIYLSPGSGRWAILLGQLVEVDPAYYANVTYYRQCPNCDSRRVVYVSSPGNTFLCTDCNIHNLPSAEWSVTYGKA